MKLKHKLLAYSMIPAILGVGYFGLNAASAHGLFGGGIYSNLTPDEIATRQSAVFQKEADLLGVSVDEVKEAWAAGKNFAQLAKDKGITEEELKAKIREARTQQMKTQLSALVAKGIITQAQADKRLQTMQNQQDNGKGKMGKRNKGMGRFGF